MAGCSRPDDYAGREGPDATVRPWLVRRRQSRWYGLNRRHRPYGIDLIFIPNGRWWNR
jgi:hypothetical protein